MNRRIFGAFYLISALFLLFVLLFSAYRLKITIDGNRDQARQTLERLRTTALAAYLAEGDSQTLSIGPIVQETFREDERLLLVSVYSIQEGVYYLLARDSSYLAEPPGLPWRGEPQYAPLPVYENRITSRFAPGVRQDLFIDGIFRDVDVRGLYPILRELFYVLIVYLLIATVFLLYATTSGRTPAERVKVRRVAAGSRPASGGQRTGGRPAANSGLFSPSSGLGWSQHLVHRLSSELERAAGSDQDLSLLLIGSGSGKVRDVADALRERFVLRDLIFEYDDATAAAILPDSDLDTSLREAESFLGGSKIGASIGLSARNGRLVSAGRLITEALRALRQARRSGDGSLVAFRADPDKYRAAISAAKRSPRS